MGLFPTPHVMEKNARCCGRNVTASLGCTSNKSLHVVVTAAALADGVDGDTDLPRFRVETSDVARAAMQPPFRSETTMRNEMMERSVLFMTHRILETTNEPHVVRNVVGKYSDVVESRTAPKLKSRALSE
jgi:hypothetical protein